MAKGEGVGKVRGSLLRLRVTGEAKVLKIRKLARKLVRLHREAGLDPLVEQCCRIWSGQSSDERMLVLEALALQSRFLRDEHWDLLRSWAESGLPQDQADLLGRELLGALVRRDRSWLRVLKHWALSTDPALRRISVMAVVSRVARMADVEAGLEMAEALVHERSASVNQALHGLLGEVRHHAPEAYENFLARWKVRKPAGLQPLLTSGS